MPSRRSAVFRISGGVVLGCIISYFLYLRLQQETIVPQVPQRDDNDSTRMPPLYPELAEAEERLSQHNEDLPFPEGRHAKFLRFGNEMWG